MTDFGNFGGSGYGMNSAESRINSLSTRIDKLETMSSSGVPYDPAVAQANPVANPNAGGVNPQQGENFQAMMQLMQSQMLAGGLGNNNDDKDKASGIENIMNNPMFNMILGGAGINGMQGNMGIPNMNGMQGMGGMNGMPNMNGMGAMNGMPVMNGMQGNAGMGSIDPAMLEQMSQTQMFDSF
jgi:hypothetical protein